MEDAIGISDEQREARSPRRPGFTRQPDNDKFIQDFFFGGRASYSGMWTGDGGRVAELPPESHLLFDDLPERSALANE